MEIETFGAGSNQIASGLKGSAPDGTCYFDELMDGLQRTGQGLAPGQHTSVGKELAPDVAKTAKEIRGLKSPDPKGGTKAFVCNIDSDKLFKPGQSTKPMNSLQDLLDNVTDRIDAARNKVGDEALGDALKNAQMAISGVQEQRIRDMGQDYIDTVNDYLKNEKQSNTKVVTDPKTDMEGNKYNAIDMEKTEAADQDFVKHWAGFSQWLDKQKGRKNPKNKVRMHYNAVRGVQGISSRVHKTCKK
jgi:hypothetical protein